MEAIALQELRKRMGLAPSSSSPLDFEAQPVISNPEGKLMSPIDATLAARVPNEFVGCPPALRDAPCAFSLSDPVLCRFLRARQYDVDKAEAMLRNCLEVRSRWQMDTILAEDDPLEDLWQRCVPVSHFGYDKRGRPVLIERTGEVRVGNLMKLLTKDDFFYRHLRHMEIVERQIDHAAAVYGPHVSQVIIIMDLANLSFKPDAHAIPLFKQMISIDTNFYPERLGAFFIINAPWIFKPLWAMVRPWLDARTQHKFHVLGSNYAATLRDYIDADQLPVEYGGTNTNVVPPFLHLPDGYQAPPSRTTHQQTALRPEPPTVAV